MKEWAEDMNRHLFKRDITDGQLDIKKMFYTIKHQGNANQNHNKIAPHICQKGY